MTGVGPGTDWEASTGLSGASVIVTGTKVVSACSAGASSCFQRNSSRAAITYCRATPDTDAPGRHASSTMRFLSAEAERATLPLEAPRTRIALVDDDDLFRESLGLNLAEEGFEVIDFAGGPSVLDYLLSGNHADAVLLDWRMPGLDGPDRWTSATIS